MRYFAECSFIGTNFVGWQRQPNATSVQSSLEGSLSTFLRSNIEIAGCGRTDAGVHASQYFFHFEDSQLPEDLVFRINQMLPEDIALRRVFEVPGDLHARFGATQRSYEYHLHFHKDPYRRQTSLYYPRGKKLNRDLMQSAGEILVGSTEFKPFCKTGSDTPHYLCDVSRAHWEYDDASAIFTITSNRFLRGMVRLIVGTMLQVGNGALSLDELTSIMETQSPLKRADSVPAHGLHLTRIVYPGIE